MAYRIGDLSYLEWLGAVDREIGRLLGGLDTDGLPDQPYREWFERGRSPRVAAVQACRSIGKLRFV